MDLLVYHVVFKIVKFVQINYLVVAVNPIIIYTIALNAFKIVHLDFMELVHYLHQEYVYNVFKIVRFAPMEVFVINAFLHLI